MILRTLPSSHSRDITSGDEDRSTQRSTMATAALRRMHEFVTESESIAAYLEQLEMFFAANDVADAKLVPSSPKCDGHKVLFATLQSSCTPSAQGAHVRGAGADIVDSL